MIFSEFDTTQTFGPAASSTRGRGTRAKRGGQPRGRGYSYHPYGRGAKSARQKRGGQTGKKRDRQTGGRPGRKFDSSEHSFFTAPDKFDPNTTGYVTSFAVAAQSAAGVSSKDTPESHSQPGLDLLPLPEDQRPSEAREQTTEQGVKLKKKREKKKKKD